MASSEADANDILMAGSLCKRTKFTRKWKKFYWRLLSGGLLRRYKDITHTKSLGQVDIKRDCYDIREGLDASSKVTFPSYIPSSCCFSISLTDKTYYMYADTPASADQWVRALSNTSGVISRRRSETDARFRELERRRIALRSTRQRRSRRYRADTMSVDLALECVEEELDHLESIEDQYVTILPPSPSHFKSQHSTASLAHRSSSVPHALNSNDNDNNNLTSPNTADSMTSLYDENEAVKPLKPTRMPPPPPTKKSEGILIDRRNSFSEDHPTLQRNTLLRETRKTHKGFFTSPQVTSTTFKIGAVDDMQLHRSPVQDEPIHTSVINTGGSPTQSESSTGVMQVLQQSNITSPISHVTNSSCSSSPPVVLHTKQNVSSSVPIKQLTSKEKVAHQNSLQECVFSPPNSAPNNSFVYPVQNQIFSFSTSENNSPANKGNLSRPSPGPHQQSLPDFMAFPELTSTNPMAVPANVKDVFSPPLVKRFSKDHQRRKSLSDFMPIASVNNPDNQKLLHKALGGTRPQSMAAQQAVIAELQIASKLT